MTSTFIISINSDAMSDGSLNSILDAITKTEDPSPTGVTPLEAATVVLLCLSLGISFVSVFFVILVKQWLKQYALVDTYGTTVDRCRDRQRRFDDYGIPHIYRSIKWLLTSLQFSFSFLTLATYTYLGGINVILSALFVPFLCPIALGSVYFILRHKAIKARYRNSPWFRRDHPSHPFTISIQIREKGPHELDIHCVSWMLQVSVDKGVQLSALEHLATMEKLDRPSPDLVADCFDVFVDCMNVIDNDVVVIQGLERLATASAMSFFRTISHLLAEDPESWVFKHILRRYPRNLPLETNFRGFPFYYTLGAIHRLFHSNEERERRPKIEWRDYKPSRREHTCFSCALVELAQWVSQENERRANGKVPRWIIRFALHSLSLDPLPPTAVVVDCLSVVAIDLGCKDSGKRGSASSRRCVLTSPYR